MSTPTTQSTPVDQSRNVQFRIWRGNKDGGEFVNYTVNVTEGMVLLDCVHRIKPSKRPIWRAVGIARPANVAHVPRKSTASQV